MVQNNLEEEVQLLAECTLFAIKWLSWRKWLRVNGILEWALNGLQIKTDEGHIEPVYPHDAALQKHLAFLSIKPSTSFSHDSDNQAARQTGDTLRELMVREQQMWAIEKQWCRLNSTAISQHPLFTRQPWRWQGSSTQQVAPETKQDGYIDNAMMVAFYQRICEKLANLFERPYCQSGQVHWKLDGMMRTFDDETILLMADMLSCCLSQAPPHSSNGAALTTNNHGQGVFRAMGNAARWLSIPITWQHDSKPSHCVVTVCLDDSTQLIWQAKPTRDLFPTPRLPLSSLRALLNPYLTAPPALYLQNDITVGKTMTCGNVLLGLLEQQTWQAGHKADNPPAVDKLTTPPITVDDLLNVIQLKYIARLLIAFSKGPKGQDVMVTAGNENPTSRFFPQNGIEWYLPLTEALLLLFHDTPHGNGPLATNINHCHIHDRVIVSEDIAMSSAITAYRQRFLSSDANHSQVFSLRVTSLLFDRDTLKQGAKRVENHSTSVRLDTNQGFYLRHATYDDTIMVFIPAHRVPQYDRQLQWDDNMAMLLGQPPSTCHADMIKSPFLRLVLVSKETANSRINLDDPLLLCAFLKDIVRYFDPRYQRIDQLFRIDPFLSICIKTDNTATYWLDNVTALPNTAANLSKKMMLKKKLWQILRDKTPPKSVLVRSSPMCYGPELYWHGITQHHKGIVPLELHSQDDSWKLYGYDDINAPIFLTDETLLKQTTWVGTRDGAADHWFITQNARIANQAISQGPVIVRLINWYGDHYPTGNPTIKKVISKRIYLINDTIAFCETPTKLLCNEKFTQEKVTQIHDWHFANYALSKKNNNAPLSAHFRYRVYQAMQEYNVNYPAKQANLRLSFYETRHFFVMFFQCTHFWFPKWPQTGSLCYHDVPKPLVPLVQWAIDSAVITTS